MNDLTPIAGRPSSLSDLAISTPLWQRLSSRFEASGEVEEIIRDPELHAEAKRIAPLLRARMAPSGDEAVRRALQPLVLVYGVGEAARSPGFWSPYRILANLPVEALAQGIEDYTAAPDSHFFPKPGPLKALCDRRAEPILKAAGRAAKAAGLPPPKPTPSEEERAAIGKMLRETVDILAANSQARRPNPVDLPNTAGKPDAGGLTKEMRESMSRRGLGA